MSSNKFWHKPFNSRIRKGVISQQQIQAVTKCDGNHTTVCSSTSSIARNYVWESISVSVNGKEVQSIKCGSGCSERYQADRWISTLRTENLARFIAQLISLLYSVMRIHPYTTALGIEPTNKGKLETTILPKLVTEDHSILLQPSDCISKTFCIICSMP